MSHYPGALNGEIFVGNVDIEEDKGIPEYLSELKTARLGDIALDIKGKLLNPEHYRPLFIGEIEAKAYDAIMMRRFSDAKRGQLNK